MEEREEPVVRAADAETEPRRTPEDGNVVPRSRHARHPWSHREPEREKEPVG